MFLVCQLSPAVRAPARTPRRRKQDTGSTRAMVSLIAAAKGVERSGVSLNGVEGTRRGTVAARDAVALARKTQLLPWALPYWQG